MTFLAALTARIEENNATFTHGFELECELECTIESDEFDTMTSKGTCELNRNGERVKVQYSTVYSSYVFDNVYDLI